MKAEIVSRYHIVLKLMDTIAQFEEDVFWDIVRIGVELLPEEVFEYVRENVASEILRHEKEVNFHKNDVGQASKRGKIKSKRSEEDEIEDVKNIVYQAVDRILGSDQHNEMARRFNSAQVFAIRKRMPSRFNPLAGNEHKGFRNELISYLREQVFQIIKDEVDELEKRIQTISTYFDLEEFEQKFILLVFHETYHHGTFLSDFIRTEPEATKLFSGINEVYEKYNLLENDDDHPLIQKGLLTYSRPRSSLILTKSCLQWILSDKDPDLMDMFLQIENCDEAYGLSSFPLDAETVEVCKHILSSDKGASMLVHGKEGTGKTEFVKSLIRNIGKKCIFLRPFNKKGKDSISERRMALYVASRVVSSIGNGILVVDEADDLLNTNKQFSFFGMTPINKDDDKAWVNQFMDKCDAKIVWIANDLNLHRSTVRRFNFMIKFPDLSHEQMCTMVSKVVGESDVEVKGELNISEIVDRFSGLTIGSFGTAVKTAEGVVGDSVVQKDVFFKVLDSHYNEIGTSGPKRTLVKNFNHELINSNYPINKIFMSVESLLAGKSHLPQLTMLLYGLPGTGKTELVHQIAKKYGLKLYSYGASDLVSKWAGESEKNIAKAFSSVGSNGKSLLFIDEADSLFTSRKTAERSWIVSQTNELLRQMENFRGIFVAATNFDTLLDEACLRRFHLKVEMLPLKPDQIVQIYQDKFKKAEGELSDSEIIRLQNLRNVAFGDIHAVWSKLSYESCLKHSEVISNLESELKWKRDKKEIGLHI